MNTTTPTKVRVVADYQMMGDLPGAEWADLILKDAKQREIIVGFEFLHSLTTVWGIQVVTFAVDFALDVFDDLGYNEAKEHATNLLNEQIVHDSDVSVRAIGAV